MPTTLATKPDQAASRTPDHEIAPLFWERWSSRSFSAEEIPDAVLFQLFEAARWAPSGGNRQPWRFIYAKRDSALWPVFVDLLNERNRVWASKAAALVFVVSQSLIERDGELAPVPNHAFDAGAAWLSLALQATLLGWNTRAMGGIHRQRAQKTLEVPDNFHVNIAIAIGKRGIKDGLPEEFHAGEIPNPRRPLAEIIAEGRFPQG